MQRTTTTLLLTAALFGCATDDNPEHSTDTDDKADRSVCSNGKKDAQEFPVIWQHFSIVEVVNVVAREDIWFLFDVDVLENLIATRDRRPFDSLAAVGCVPQIGVAALHELEDVSMGECGLGDARAATDKATARMCYGWAQACGNDPFAEGGDRQRACHTAKPQGVFERVAKDGDGFESIPVRIDFAGKRFTATYHDGRVEEGRAQQSEKSRESGDIFTYMLLWKDDGEFNSNGFYHATLADSGNRLTLSPLMGPIGRDVTAPVFVRATD